MKRGLCVVLILGLVLCAGQVLAADEASQSTNDVPDIQGTWKGTAAGHHQEHGHVRSHPRNPGILTITQQMGRAFAGRFTWKSADNRTDEYQLSGVIGADNKTLYIASADGGMEMGFLEPDGTLTMVKLVPGDKARALFRTLKKEQ